MDSTTIDFFIHFFQFFNVFIFWNGKNEEYFKWRIFNCFNFIIEYIKMNVLRE